MYIWMEPVQSQSLESFAEEQFQRHFFYVVIFFTGSIMAYTLICLYKTQHDKFCLLYTFCVRVHITTKMYI